jgi:hypothetical protein
MFVFVARQLHFQNPPHDDDDCFDEILLMLRRKLPVNHSPLFLQIVIRSFTSSIHKVR